jgi:hypothetical protein
MTCLSSRGGVNLKPILEEALLLVTPSDILVPSWDILIQLGFIDHPDGAYHAGQLLGVNFPEFQNSHQFKRSGFSNEINLILEPVRMELGFTVLPIHAVNAFKKSEKKSEKVKIHGLTNKVSETLYMGLHRVKFALNRVSTVISEEESCLSNI